LTAVYLSGHDIGRTLASDAQLTFFEQLFNVHCGSLGQTWWKTHHCNVKNAATVGYGIIVL
jgi:hypothetical protein